MVALSAMAASPEVMREDLRPGFDEVQAMRCSNASAMRRCRAWRGPRSNVL